MKIEGLIHLKSYTDLAMASLYFMRILISFSSFSTVKPSTMITGCAVLALKKEYFRSLGHSLRISPLELFFTSCPLSSPVLNFSTLISFRLNIVSLISKLESRYSTS